MENKNNQNTTSTFDSGTSSDAAGQAPAEIATAPFQPLSLDQAPGVEPTSPAVVFAPQPSLLARVLRRADVILALLLVLGASGLFWTISRGPSGGDRPESSSSLAAQYGTTSIPLEEFSTGSGIDFSDQNVTINGQLHANSDFVLTPSARPTDPTKGQIYYDQTSNVLAYYDGTQFVEMLEGVTSLQGQNGAIALNGAGGITITNDGAGNLTIDGPNIPDISAPEPSPAGVTSINGATGALTVDNTTTSGTTITVNNASTSQKGIAQFNDINFTATAGVINTVQSINTGATPTFAGINANSVNASTIQGTGGLSLLSSANVTIGANDTAGTLFVVDTKTTVGDPTGTNGAIYYNAASGNFRCYQGGAWANCITASGGLVSLQNAYDNSSPAVINLNATNDGLLVRDAAGGIAGELFAVQNSAGSTNYLAVTSTGASVGGTLGVSGAATLQSTLQVQGGALTIGTITQQGSLNLHAGNTNVGVLQSIASLGQNTTYTLPDPGQATTTICLSTGNCAGTGSGVTTSGGTVGAIPLFTASQNVENSIITQSGLAITVTGSLAVSTGSLSLDNALAVSNGGTGAVSLTANGVLVGNGTSAVSAVTAGGTGLCLVSTAGAPTWSACPGSGGVSSVNSQTGAVNIANASGAGGTITIDDASTVAKGIASFNSTNFSVSSGAVNTIQDINTGATPTFAGVNTDTITPSSTLTVVGGLEVQGSIAGASTLSLASGANIGVFQPTTLTGDRTYTLPDDSGTVCLSTGNCAGQGGSVGGSGTQNRIAKFTATGSNIGDSSISDTGSQVTVNGNVNLSVEGTTLSVGQASSRTGSIVLQNSTNANTVTVQSGVTSASYALTLPSAAGSANQCLKAQNGTGTLYWDDCLGGGGSSGITSINSQTGPSVTINNASASGNTVTIDNASTSAKGIAQFNGTNFSVTSGVVNTVQDIDVTATPEFAGLDLTGNINVTSGGQYQINGSQISSAALSNNSDLAKLGSSQTFTGSSNVFRNGTNSTSAFSVQDAAGISVAAVDTTNGQLILGTSSVLDGSLVFNNATNANTITIQTGTPTASRTLTLPDADGTICTSSGNCAGAGATLQTAYSFSAGGTTPKIKLNSTLAGLDVQDADTTIGSDLLTVRASNGAGLGSGLFSVGNTGAVTLQNSANSTTAFQLLTQGGDNLLSGNTTNGQVILGDAGSLAGSLVIADGGSSFSGTIATTTLSVDRTYTLPNESGTICLQSSSNCGFADSSGSSSYIQNQSASDQTASFRISGTGRAGTAFQAPSFDVASAGTLAIGGANATTVNIANNAAAHAVNIGTSSSASQILTAGSTNGLSVTSIQGGGGIGLLTNTSTASVVIKSNVNSATALQVQNASSQSLFTVNTSTNNVAVNADLSASANIDIVATTLSTGVIRQAGARWLHSAGGASNFFAGSNSGNLTLTGIDNVGVGLNTLQATTSGSLNTAVGSEALSANTNGFYNAALGYNALLASTEAYYGSAFGARALFSNTTGDNNTAIGGDALYENTTGANNAALAYSALSFNETGNTNVAIGPSAGVTNNTGNANVSGSNNVFIGSDAGPASATQLSNATALGANAVVGQNNSMTLGCIAGTNDCTTSTNVGIGTSTPQQALHIDRGAEKSHIQTTNDATGHTANDGLYLGIDHLGEAYMLSLDNEQLYIGTNGTPQILVQPTTGNVGIRNLGPAYPLHVGSNSFASGTAIARFQNAGGTCTVTPSTAGGVTCTSDSRLKKNIEDYNGAIDVVNKIDVKQYNMLADKDTDQKQIGVIAQQLEELVPSLVDTDQEGYKSVSYGGLTPILLQAIKEQQHQIDELKTAVGGQTGAVNNLSIKGVTPWILLAVVVTAGIVIVTNRTHKKIRSSK